jgi:putative flippase GtrA
MYRYLMRHLALLIPYTGSGMTGFALDLFLFSLLLTVIHVHYLIATILGFLVGASLHFILSRRYVFTRSKRTLRTAYAYFLTIALLGLITVSALMYVAVDVLNTPEVAARIAVAGLVGLCSFYLHKRFSFRYQEVGTGLSS